MRFDAVVGKKSYILQVGFWEPPALGMYHDTKRNHSSLAHTPNQQKVVLKCILGKQRQRRAKDPH